MSELPYTVQQAWGAAVARDFVTWLDEYLHEAQPAPRVQVSAFVARQKVNVLVLERISNLLLAGEPRLVQQVGEPFDRALRHGFTSTGLSTSTSTGLSTSDKLNPAAQGGPQDRPFDRAQDKRWVWRVPVDLTFPSHGRVGCVGELDVDARYGQVCYTDTMLTQMADEARRLAEQVLHPTR